MSARGKAHLCLDWWCTQRRAFRLRSAVTYIVVALICLITVYTAAHAPQPRMALAAAAFGVTVLADAILVPLLRGLLEAIVLHLAAHSSGEATHSEALLSGRPSLLDFCQHQVRAWTSSEALLGHWERELRPAGLPALSLACQPARSPSLP